MPMAVLPNDWESEYRLWDRNLFEVDWTDTFGAYRFAAVAETDIFVYWGLQYNKGEFYASNHIPVLLDVFILRCQPDHAEKTDTGASSRQGTRPTAEDTDP